MAILHLPYAYEIEYVPKGKRNPQTEKLRASVPVEVCEVSADEAPVAFSMTLPRSLDGTFADGTWKETVRRLGDTLLRPLSGRGGPVGLAEFARDVARHQGEWRRDMLGGLPDGAPRWSGDNYPHLPLLDGNGFGRRSVMGLCDYDEFATDEAGSPSRLRFRSSDREAREAEAREILGRGIAVVDGMVWTSAHAREPVWEVTARDGGANVKHSFGQDSLWYVHKFRIDHGAEALAWAEELAGATGGRVSVSAATLDEYDPSLLRRDDLVSLSMQAMSGVAWGTVNRAQFEPWSDEAEECLGRLRAKRGRPADGREAIEALQAVRALRAALMEMPDWHGKPTARDNIERTEPAAARWDAACTDPRIAAEVDEIEADAAAFGMM